MTIEKLFNGDVYVKRDSGVELSGRRFCSDAGSNTLDVFRIALTGLFLLNVLFTCVP